MPQSRDQSYIPGLQQPFLRRMATFPVILAAIPFNLLKQWIAQKIPSAWRLTSLRGLGGNLWDSIPAAITTEGISIFGFHVSSFLSRPSLGLLTSSEPPPPLCQDDDSCRLIDDFDGQQFVRRISHQVSLDRDRPDVRRRRHLIRTSEIYDWQYRLVFDTVQGRVSFVRGAQARPRLIWGRIPIQLKRIRGESQLRFMTDKVDLCCD